MWPPLLAMHLWALLLMSRITLLIMVGLRFATCHRILVPKSQVESIFQCFGLIFILMDPLGALLNTLGANLLKSVFLETPCTFTTLSSGGVGWSTWWHHQGLSGLRITPWQQGKISAFLPLDEFVKRIWDWHWTMFCTSCNVLSILFLKCAYFDLSQGMPV